MSGARVWRTSFEHASLTAVFKDGVKESALSKKTFATLQAKIMHVPEGGIREFALKRIEILYPDIFGPEASERETLEKGHVDKAAYRESLAGQLKSLACSGDEDAVHIVRGLIANGRIWETGAHTPGLVVAIVQPKTAKDCPVSAALTDADKASRKRIAKEASGAH